MREVDAFYSNNGIRPTGVACGEYSVDALKKLGAKHDQVKAY